MNKIFIECKPTAKNAIAVLTSGGENAPVECWIKPTSLAAALTACQEYANAVQAFGHPPTRGGKRPNSGAPIGNSNGRKEIVREISLTMRLSQQEYETIAAANGGKKLSTWLREIALAAANEENTK